MNKNFLFKAFSVILLPGVLLSSLPEMAGGSNAFGAGHHRDDGYIGTKAPGVHLSKKQAFFGGLAAVAGVGIATTVGYFLGEQVGHSNGFRDGQVFGNRGASQTLDDSYNSLQRGREKYEDFESSGDLVEPWTRRLNDDQDRRFADLCENLRKGSDAFFNDPWNITDICEQRKSAAYRISNSKAEALNLIRNAEINIDSNNAHNAIESLQGVCAHNPKVFWDSFKSFALSICPNFRVPTTCTDLVKYLLQKQSLPVMQAVLTLFGRNQVVVQQPQYPQYSQYPQDGQYPQYPQRGYNG